jgi:hypothetical protein
MPYKYLLILTMTGAMFSCKRKGSHRFTNATANTTTTNGIVEGHCNTQFTLSLLSL